MGFVTNSSSNHTIIFPDHPVKDNLPEGSGHYGWSDFTLASKEMKLDYLGRMIYENMRRITSPDYALWIAHRFTGAKITKNGEVDHRSLWTLPLAAGGKELDRRFLEHLRAFLMRQDVVILGGNDNDDGHPLADGSEFRFPFTWEDGSLRARWEEGQRYWTLFNRETGALMRFRFDPRDATPINHPDRPEALDMKITDFCTRGCAYCYQSSHPGGDHAQNLLQWADVIEQLGVFEVAIGGGEPMSHPQLPEFLRELRRRDIVPHVTTRDWSWLHDNDRRSEILKHVGRIAYSVDNLRDTRRVLSQAEHWGIIDKITLHHVVGVTPESDFIDLLVMAHCYRVPVILLSFKAVGRGRHFEPDRVNWKQVVHKYTRFIGGVGIDTGLAQQIRPDDGIPSWCYHTVEGNFTMYLDAVRRIAKRSSYEEDVPEIEIAEGKTPEIQATQLLTAFRAWQR